MRGMSGHSMLVDEVAELRAAEPEYMPGDEAAAYQALIDAGHPVPQNRQQRRALKRNIKTALRQGRSRDGL